MFRSGADPGVTQPQLSQAPHRSGWLGWLPVSALEDSVTKWSLEDNEAMEAVEADPDDNNDLSDPEGGPSYEELPLVFCCPRHQATGDVQMETIMQTWRMRERMKTVSVALVICLNVGVDPPDVTKTQPCARQECWVDPGVLQPQRALETIGANLQRQYERWQPRARYRQSLDPTVDEVRRLATGLRRSARDERVLFHYNGHGVPKPTSNGEIWVFNRHYTQYIPLSIYDLQTWMGSPSIYVWDCNNAGIIVESFKNFAEQHEREYVEQMSRQQAAPGPAGLQGESGDPEMAPPSLRNCIQLAACGKDQLLPMNPELAAADLFTACLTTPIKMALRWFVMTNDLGHLAPEVKLEQLEKIPGQFQDRKTMFGELNWIFTAITDTIAWNTLPRDTFQKLFRQDLLVASLFRNFLLAQRIMKANDCTPISQPKLPDTHQHPMWEAWDLALDICLSQLKGILEEDKVYVPSSFFEEQLTAFEVWLSHGSEERAPPEQLPIVLQVLLSQAHRLRALDLLGRFLDLGAWAVNLALSVGIFPYVLKLLQSSARELRPLLVFIWAKILAVDQSCQHDLVRDQGSGIRSHKYFLTVLQDPAMLVQHKTWAVFVLSSVVRNYKQGQDEAVSGHLISICLNELEDSDPTYRQWLVICLATCWDNHEEARGTATRDNAPDKLETLLADPNPEVRAAAVMALGTFINSCKTRREHENTLDQNIAIRLVQNNLEDGSPLVRRELVVAIQSVIFSFLHNFLSLLRAVAEEDECQAGGSGHKLGASRISGEDRLSRQMAGSRRSVIGPPGNLGSNTDLSGNNYNPGSTLTTPRRIRKSVVATPGHHSASLISLASLSCYGPGVTSKFKPFYLRVLGGLMVLETDPDTEVSGLARSVLDSLHTRMMAGLGAGERKNSSSVFRSHSQADVTSTSLPGSPSRPSFTLGSSPPVSGLNSTLPNLSLNTSASMSRSLLSSVSSVAEASAETKLVTTNFPAWSASHFSSKLMRLCEESEDLESEDFWKRQWMFERNNVTRARASAERASLEAGTGRLDESLHVHRVSPGQPRVLAWESYTSGLFTATQDTVHYYRDSSHVLWSNGNPRVSHISSLVTCNSHASANLMVGSDDGCVRVWSMEPDASCGTESVSDSSPRGSQVTGWLVMPELVPQSLSSGSRVSCGLQMAWDQHSMTLIAGGDHKNLRIWDCSSELKVADIPTQLDTCVTCIQTGLGENRHVAGVSFGDGHVKVYDMRTRGCVMTVREHKQMVLGIRLHQGHSLISGCADGVVKVWDMRRQASTLTHDTGQPSISLEIHPSCQLMSVAHTNGQLSIHNTVDGRVVNFIRHPNTRLQSSVTALRFHPNLLQLAAASSDSSVAVFGFRKY